MDGAVEQHSLTLTLSSPSPGGATIRACTRRRRPHPSAGAGARARAPPRRPDLLPCGSWPALFRGGRCSSVGAPSPLSSTATGAPAGPHAPLYLPAPPASSATTGVPCYTSLSARASSLLRYCRRPLLGAGPTGSSPCPQQTSEGVRERGGKGGRRAGARIPS
jgi:hypothetical protein